MKSKEEEKKIWKFENDSFYYTWLLLISKSIFSIENLIYFTNQSLKEKTRSSNNSKYLVLEQTFGHTNSSLYFHWQLSSSVWDSNSKENSSGQTTRSYLSGIYNSTFSSFLDEKIVCVFIFQFFSFHYLKESQRVLQDKFQQVMPLFPCFSQGPFLWMRTSIFCRSFKEDW